MSEKKALLNEDLLGEALPSLREWEGRMRSGGVPLMFTPSKFVEFCVLSGLAPQAAEPPFSGIIRRFSVMTKRRKQFLFPRGHTKTSIAKALVAYLICEHGDQPWGPRIRCAFVGETGLFAARNVKAVRRILETNEYLLGKYGASKPSRSYLREVSSRLLAAGADAEDVSVPEWTQKKFRTLQCIQEEIRVGNSYEEPTVSAMGMDESTTGSHFDVILIDDPVTEKSARSPARKEKTLGVYYDLQSQLSPDGVLVDIGTRHAIDDLHSVIQSEHRDDYDIEVFSCWANGPELHRDDFRKSAEGVYVCLRPLDEVEVFWPGFGQLEAEVESGERSEPGKRKELALHFLAEKLYSMPASRFGKQYLNRAVADEDKVFFDEWFRFYRSEEVPKRVNNYILTDSATGKDLRSSYRVVAVVSVDEHDHKYVRSLAFGKWEPGVYVQRILDDYKRWGARSVLMEKVAWQKAFKSLMDLQARVAGDTPPRVVDVTGRSLVEKVERIEPLEVELRNGRLLFDPRLKEEVSEDGRNVWEELKREFLSVSEEDAVRGLRLDIPDAISDILALDTKGVRICRPPRRRLNPPKESGKIEAKHVMEPLRKRLQESKKRNRSIWDRPVRKAGGIW